MSKVRRKGDVRVPSEGRKPDPRNCNVYVIRLDPAVAGVRRFRLANPDRRPDKPCVYVGKSARTPEERFEQHLHGYRASRLVHKYGLSLMPRLYVRYNPMTDAAARDFEVELARRLRKRGYGVWQN